jgi:N-acetylmuramoyl-L-alanine amidase
VAGIVGDARHASLLALLTQRGASPLADLMLTRRTLLARTARSGAAAVFLATFAGPLSSLAADGAARPRKVAVQDFLAAGGSGAFTGPSQQLPIGTTHVGFQWRGEVHKRIQIAARANMVDDGWSEWVDLMLDDDPFGMERTFTTLLDVRGATAVQYRARVPQGHRVDSVIMTAIGADTEPSGTALASTVSAAAPPQASFTTLDGKQRAVFRREDWACDEGGSAYPWKPMFVPVKKMLVHHTATSNKYTDGVAEVRAIYAYHAITKQWGDIGYNVLVDRFGNVYEGRRGRDVKPSGSSTEIITSPPGREVVSRGVVAGHCFNHNYGSSGIAVLGDFTKRKINMANATDQAMLAALDDLMVYECGRNGLAPTDSSEFLRSDGAWHDAMPTITGHKDDEATACPGTSLYSYMTGTLRSNVASRLSEVSLHPPTVALQRLTGRQLAVGSTASFSWVGPATEATGVEYKLEGWRRVTPTADDLVYLVWNGSSWASDTVEHPAWTTGPLNGQVGVSKLPAGHFTLHVRAVDAAGKHSVLDNNSTVLAV